MFSDDRLVLTLDAGGTNFVFNAIQKGRSVTESIKTPSFGHDLPKCLKTIINGFEKVISNLDAKPVAISFAFPGPADYPNGIIGDLANLSGFRGGVALGDMLQEYFEIPVYIQNDGDLYAYGEALGGILPEINKTLTAKGISKQYKNLIGLTLGTGFGAGLVHDGTLITGDNSIAAEVWNIGNTISPDKNAEEGVSTRAIINIYNELASEKNGALMPKDIFDIATEKAKGDKEAALQAFKTFGTHLGDAVANLINLFDGIVVIGGGLTGASSLYMPEVMSVLRGTFENKQNRLVHGAYLLDNEDEKDTFYTSGAKTINIPFSEKTKSYDPEQKVAIATSKLDASDAIAMGAYAYALNMLDKK
ncbi:ROK family protein [Labilibacter sediminis]|nr:ROK family protein [Labilibacter sediminis]